MTPPEKLSSKINSEANLSFIYTGSQKEVLKEPNLKYH